MRLEYWLRQLEGSRVAHVCVCKGTRHYVEEDRYHARTLMYARHCVCAHVHTVTGVPICAYTLVLQACLFDNWNQE
jgi:hypothetical protein